MTELIAVTQKALQSQSWKMKAQGGAAMATIAKQQTGSLVAPHLGMLLSALLQALAGRTWAGKVSAYTASTQNIRDASCVVFQITRFTSTPVVAACISLHVCYFPND